MSFQPAGEETWLLSQTSGVKRPGWIRWGFESLTLQWCAWQWLYKNRGGGDMNFEDFISDSDENLRSRKIVIYGTHGIGKSSLASEIGRAHV